MRGLVGFLVVLSGALAAPPSLGAQQAPPDPAAYAVFGLERVALRAGTRVEAGDVGANRGAVVLGAGVRIAGAVAADTVRVGAGARVTDLFCRLVIGPARFACGSLSLPVVDVATLPLVQVVPGASPVRVPARGATAPLAPGAYGAMRVGPRGRLLLAGGDYAVGSIAIGPRGRLLCAAPCRLSVEAGVVLGPRALLGAAGPFDAQAIRLDIEGNGRRVAFVARPRATVAASVYAPQAAIALGSHARTSGTLVGRSVTVGAGSRIGAEP